jgi:outer membrane scaffolding protein for murein synthesis (MipA/OmpV family)
MPIARQTDLSIFIPNSCFGKAMANHTSRLRVLQIALGCAMSLASWSCALAQQPQEAAGKPPLWELGGFTVAVSQQAYPGSDQQINRALALPFFIYRGEFLRVDRDTAGLRAIKTSNFELDIGVAGAFGGDTTELEARRGMPKLGTLVEAGPRVRWNFAEAPGWGRWRVELPLRAVFDLSDHATHRGLSFEPKVVFDSRPVTGWFYGASVSAVLADQPLARTFYDVTPAQATAQRAAYSAKSGLVSWRLATSISRSLSPDWRLFGFARLDTVAGAANEDSPLVRQKTGASVGVGLVYTWTRSAQTARDLSPPDGFNNN